MVLFPVLFLETGRVNIWARRLLGPSASRHILEYPGLVARSERILDHIFKGPKFPDILLLLEVASSGVRQSLLSDPRVRSSFLVTDAEDDTSFKGVPFATMALLDSVLRMELPNRYKRDALCVNIAAPAAPGTALRLLNVHLESLDAKFRRTVQIHVLASLLRDPGCSGVIIAGDFQRILPGDHKLIDEHELVDDTWLVLHRSTTGPDGGAT